MREYETTFIVQPEISDEGLTSIYERLDGILAADLNLEEPDVRRRAASAQWHAARDVADDILDQAAMWISLYIRYDCSVPVAHAEAVDLATRDHLLSRSP